MSFLPSYHYYVGSKHEVFMGIKDYLKTCKDFLDAKQIECDNLFNETQELKKK